MGSPQALGLRACARGYVRTVGPWKTLRWPLAATVLAAMAVNGCGAAGGRTARLPKTSEKALLTLVARARTDVSHHHDDAAHAVLAAFVSKVSRLRTAGELNAATAGGLDRQARLTSAQIARQRRTLAADHANAGQGAQPLITAAPDPGKALHAHGPGDHPNPGNDKPKPGQGPPGPKDHHPDGGGPGDWLPTSGGPGGPQAGGGGPQAGAGGPQAGGGND